MKQESAIVLAAFETISRECIWSISCSLKAWLS